MTHLSLDTPVQYVKGVGPTRSEQLAMLGVETAEDLLSYYPRRFDLRRQSQPIETLTGNEKTATVAGQVVEVRERRFGKRPYLECSIDDGTGAVLVKWFHGGYLRDTVKVDAYLAISGKASTYKECIQFINPTTQVIWDPQGTDLSIDELLPVYPAGAKLSSNIIGRIIKNALPELIGLVQPWFDRKYLSDRSLMGRSGAIAAMHLPDDKDQWARARRRLAYDECFLMQLGLAVMRMRQVSRPAHQLKLTDQIDQRIRSRLPFELTDAQNRVVAEVAADLFRSKPMNRLVQGDVGSGKTVVALYGALLAVANRTQAALMAPTEILATQHFQKIQDYLAGSKVKIALLVGNQPRAKRAEILDKLAAGKIDIIVGTHALISEDVRFARLSLVIVDEQHKFGVRQRTSIRSKGFAPHYLVMTATPIPRTLSLTLFGDLDVSIIDSLPPGRGKTTTRLIAEGDLDGEMDFIRAKLSAGQQAYFIYPLVSASDSLDLTAATEAYEHLSQGPLKDFEVGLIHGQMPQAQKDEAMTRFRAGEIDALASSVVVEVGVDVPTANIMVIMHAERFGLAQLHQLRGRIGRGTEDATCILVGQPKNPIAQRRLEILVGTDDGFKVAEEDLRIRGPGEFFGTRQHGLPELKVADLIEDFDLLRLARRDAFEVIAADPDLSAPANQQLRREVIRAYAGRLELIAGA